MSIIYCIIPLSGIGYITTIMAKAYTGVETARSFNEKVKAAMDRYIVTFAVVVGIGAVWVDSL